MVISFADNSNIVGEIATRVLDIASRWVRSGSTDFDVIMASTIDAEWAFIRKKDINLFTYLDYFVLLPAI